MVEHQTTEARPLPLKLTSWFKAVHALQDEGNVWHMAAPQSAAISSVESKRENDMIHRIANQLIMQHSKILRL